MQSKFIYDRTPRFMHQCVLNAYCSTGKERDTESGNDYLGAGAVTDRMPATAGRATRYDDLSDRTMPRSNES
jgi:hypothetical protein